MPKPRAVGSKRKVFDLWKRGLSARQIFDEHVPVWPPINRPDWRTVRGWVIDWDRGNTKEFDGHE